MNRPDAASRLHQWEDWLRSTDEAVLDAELPIIDPHHHLWNRGGHQYLAEEYAADMSGHRVVATLYVECQNEYRSDGPAHLRAAGETLFARGIGDHSAQMPGLCAGIVSFADIGATAQLLELIDVHRKSAGNSFKGIRYVTAWDASTEVHGAYPTRPRMLEDPDVRTGARLLGKAGLSLDLWLYFHQLADASSLAQSCPDLTIIIDHCGGPIGAGPYQSQRDAVFSTWVQGIQALARHPNVVMKFGGLGMAIAGFGWRRLPAAPDSATLADAWRPYFDACLESFGHDRLMFESNFPVDRTGCSGRALWNAFKRLSRGLSDAERTALFTTTAGRVYRLEDVAPVQ